MNENNEKSRPKIGLALSGGAARGTAHLGVLKALEEHGIRPDCISGTSIGAFIAGLYAFGVSIEELKDIAEKIKWIHVTSFTLSKLGFLSNEDVAELIEKSVGKVRIEDAKIPLAIIAADISTGEKIVMRSGDLAEAVTASTCIPGVFAPVKMGEKYLVDGLVVENVPVSPLKGMGADVIIAVNLGSERKYRDPDDLLDVLLNAFYIAVDRASQDDIAAADVLIEPRVAQFRRTDLKKVPELFSEGYRAAALRVDNIYNCLDHKKRKKRRTLFGIMKKLLNRGAGAGA